MVDKETKMYRVVCRDDAGEIAFRTKAQDQYDAFERIGIFLRKKEFDYQIVLVEFCRSTLPSCTRRASALR
jgi:hypothetical protein